MKKINSNKVFVLNFVEMESPSLYQKSRQKIKSFQTDMRDFAVNFQLPTQKHGHTPSLFFSFAGFRATKPRHVSKVPLFCGLFGLRSVWRWSFYDRESLAESERENERRMWKEMETKREHEKCDFHLIDFDQ